ncbi:MAG: SRPBCC family protein [Flavobacteriales bacterium]|nr:SRPBCC family protein [Flavobacteriales bacterium]
MKKFTCSVDINAPMHKVVELWQDPNQLQHWQEGFLGIEPLSGEKGAVGSTMKMRYKMNRSKKEFQLIETILVNDLPNQFIGQYEGPGMVNTMNSEFQELPNGMTRWQAEIDYKIIRGFMMKLIAAIAPSMFKRQTQKWLDRFKELVESST